MTDNQMLGPITLGCHGEKRRHHLDGRRRKRLVKVSNKDELLISKIHLLISINMDVRAIFIDINN